MKFARSHDSGPEVEVASNPRRVRRLTPVEMARARGRLMLRMKAEQGLDEATLGQVFSCSPRHVRRQILAAELAAAKPPTPNWRELLVPLDDEA